MNTAILAISGISIKQDSHGRFCLNDLHKAAGGENKHRPSLWVENQQTKALISELESEAGIPALVSLKGGKVSGTFAAKELVYAYAMWISAKFHIAVIRAYDAIVSKPAYALRELPPSTLTTEMKNHVQEMVNALKHQTGKVHNTIYHDLKTHFKVSSYTEIPIVKYADVCAYFGKKPIHKMPDLIQCDSRYLAGLEQKFIQLEQKVKALPAPVVQKFEPIAAGCVVLPIKDFEKSKQIEDMISSFIYQLRFNKLI